MEYFDDNRRKPPIVQITGRDKNSECEAQPNPPAHSDGETEESIYHWPGNVQGYK